MGLFSRIKRKKDRETDTTYHCVNMLFTEDGKHDRDYNLLTLSQKIPDCNSNSIDVKGDKEIICGLCKKKSFSYLQDNIIFTKQADNINALIPNSGIYCLNCDLDVCSDCMSYHLLFSSFRGPTVRLPNNQIATSNTCDYEDCIKKYDRIVPQEDWVKWYGFVCPKCGVQYGVCYMPALSKVLFDNSIYSHSNRPPLYVTKLSWIELDKFFTTTGNDEEILAQIKEKLKKVPMEVIRQAIDEASTVFNAMEQRGILKIWQIIFKAGLVDLIAKLGISKAYMEITEKPNDSNNIKYKLEVANCAKNWCELISDESKYKDFIAQNYKFFNKIQIGFRELCLKQNI